MKPERRRVSPSPHRAPLVQSVGRILLGAFLLFAGVAHLTFARAVFQAQVPDWVPLDKDFVVLASGIAEIALGSALIFPGRYTIPVGIMVAIFLVAIFPGNISQFVTRSDAFGLTSDLARGLRLMFQPALVLWALWSCGVLSWLRSRQKVKQLSP